MLNELTTKNPISAKSLSSVLKYVRTGERSRSWTQKDQSKGKWTFLFLKSWAKNFVVVIASNHRISLNFYDFVRSVKIKKKCLFLFFWTKFWTLYLSHLWNLEMFFFHRYFVFLEIFVCVCQKWICLSHKFSLFGLFVWKLRLVSIEGMSLANSTIQQFINQKLTPYTHTYTAMQCVFVVQWKTLNVITLPER